ncbi:hypothetical protein PVK06_043449 [Gossypium arboreum]|uniref:Uncharacterized protein n=1 Tax=Gossypium arboreum TaxID=29729 RepID=A0ABR0MP02_GOSAR|nr:hypothetical protein PVK06_043449 [Gossypium arboreum]
MASSSPNHFAPSTPLSSCSYSLPTEPIPEELRETLEKENAEGQSLQALVDSTKRDKVIEVTMAKGERDRAIVEANSYAMDEMRNTLDLA